MRIHFLTLSICIMGSLYPLTPEGQKVFEALQKICYTSNEHCLWLVSSVDHILRAQWGVWYTPDGTKFITTSRHQSVLFNNHTPIPHNVTYYHSDHAYHYKEEANEIAPHLWDAATGEELLVYTSGNMHKKEILYVAFDQDGTEVVFKSGKKDKELFYFHTTTGYAIPGSFNPSFDNRKDRILTSSNGVISVERPEMGDQALIVKKNDNIEIGRLYHGDHPREISTSCAINPIDHHELISTGNNWLAKIWYFIDESIVDQCRPQDVKAIKKLVKAIRHHKDTGSIAIPEHAAPAVQKIFRHLTWKPNGKEHFTYGSMTIYTQ